MSDRRSASERLAESWLSEADVAELKAEAWAGGYLRGTLDEAGDLHPADNPYEGLQFDVTSSCDQSCSLLTPCSEDCEAAHGWLGSIGRHCVGPIEPGERP